MNDKSYATSFVVEKTPEEVFKAINNVRAWWIGKIEGETDKLGDEFIYSYSDIHRTKQKITELVAGKKVVWHVLEANLSFTETPDEWVGTDVIFELSEKDGKTEVHFTHAGLTPALACYGACSSGWSAFIDGNLQGYINTGEVQPDPFKVKE